MNAEIVAAKKQLPLPDLLGRLGLGDHAKATARCPFHQDDSPSFSVFQHEGRWFWKCHAGCGKGDEIEFLQRCKRLEKSQAIRLYLDLAGQNRSRFRNSTDSTRGETSSQFHSSTDSAGGKPSWHKQEVATYDYIDENGQLLFQAVRYEPKDFRQRRPSGNGGWVWNLKGVQLVLYRLPDVIKATGDILIVEGEKDADRLAALGFAATCNPMGAGKWRSEYSESLKGKNVVILPDNDEPGLAHAHTTADSLRGVAQTVRQLRVPNGKDVSDYLSSFQNDSEAVNAINAMLDAPEEKPIDGGGVTPCGTGGIVESTSGVTDLLPPEKYYPADSLVSLFVDYSSPQIETPTHFVVAGALSLISIIANRSVSAMYLSSLAVASGESETVNRLTGPAGLLGFLVTPVSPFRLLS
jgi:hypothetical protein